MSAQMCKNRLCAEERATGRKAACIWLFLFHTENPPKGLCCVTRILWTFPAFLTVLFKPFLPSTLEEQGNGFLLD